MKKGMPFIVSRDSSVSYTSYLKYRGSPDSNPFTGLAKVLLKALLSPRRATGG